MTTSPATGGWFKVPDAAVMRAAEVGPYALAVYMVIRQHADKMGVAFPSAQRIATLTGMSRRKVFQATTTLELARWIGIKRATGTNGRPMPNLYTILPLSSSELGSPSPATGMVNDVHQDGEPRSPGMVNHVRKNQTHIEPDLLNQKKAGNKAARLEIPNSLNTNAFEVAWNEWLAYRRERKLTVTPRTLAAQLKLLAGWGPDKAVSSVRQSPPCQ